MFEFRIAARTVWSEARGEGALGIRAVAHVLMNRKLSGHWGTTLATVCCWPYQFSCWIYGDPNWKPMLELPEEDEMLLQCYGAVAGAATSGDLDPTQGALFYYADYIAPPPWAAHMHVTVKIGRHIFLGAEPEHAIAARDYYPPPPIPVLRPEPPPPAPDAA